MKKIITKILIVLSIFSLFWFQTVWNTYAWVKVTVTEEIPWAWCVPDWKRYICTVEKWFESVSRMMWDIIKYFTYLATLAWVLFIVINGILYSMWWMDQSLKDESKKRIIWTLMWLALLFLSWVILNMIAPWIYKWG